MQLKIKRVTADSAFPLPEYATEGAACFDLRACLTRWVGSGSAPGPNASLSVPTGFAFEIPEGHVMLIFGRSGHGFKENTRLANCVGVIDSDYRGQVHVKLTRDDENALLVRHGDRIAQAMVLPVQQVTFEEVSELSDTARGTSGFGSTGV